MLPATNCSERVPTLMHPKIALQSPLQPGYILNSAVDYRKAFLCVSFIYANYASQAAVCIT